MIPYIVIYIYIHDRFCLIACLFAVCARSKTALAETNWWFDQWENQQVLLHKVRGSECAQLQAPTPTL